MRKNAGQDDIIRKLERKVLSGDLSAVPQLAKLYARAGRYAGTESEEESLFALATMYDGDVNVRSFTKMDDAVDYCNTMLVNAAERLVQDPDDDADDVFGMDVTDAEVILENREDAMEAYNANVSFDSGIHFAIFKIPLNPKFEPPKPQPGDTALMPRHFTREELEAMPTLGVSQVDNRKYDQDGWRVWLSRGTLADGETMAGRVTVEHIVDGEWVQWEEYDVGPREPDEESADEQDAPAPPRRRPRPRPGVMEGLTGLQARRAPIALQAYNNSAFGRRIVSVSNWNVAGNTWTCVVNFSAGPSVVFMVLFRPRSIEIEETSELEA